MSVPEEIESIIKKYRDYVLIQCRKSPFFDGWVEGTTLSHGDADYQLMSMLYKNVAGNNADQRVLKILDKYLQHFTPHGITAEELSYLQKHFYETIEYEFAHGSDWVGDDAPKPRDNNVISYGRECFLKLYSSSAKPHNNVFISNTEFCDLAVQMNNSTVFGYTRRPDLNDKERWALGQIRMFASEIESKIERKFIEPSEPLDLVFFDDLNSFQEEKICQKLYNKLSADGQMMIVLREESLVHSSKEGKQMSSFIEQLILDKALISATSYTTDWIELEIPVVLLHIGKDRVGKDVAMGIYMDDKTSIININVDYENLDPEILWPSYYLTEKPKSGVPLTTIAQSNFSHDWEQLDVAIDVIDSLSDCDTDSFSEVLVNKQDLLKVSDFSEDSRFYLTRVDRPCVLLQGYGNYYGIKVVHEISESGYVAKASYAQLIPKENVDLLFLAKVLLLPEVRRQLKGYCSYNINAYNVSMVLDKVLIPVFSAEERINLMSITALYSLVDIQAIQKQKQKEYESDVRMRKHALSQLISPLSNNFRTLLHVYEQKGKMLNGDDCVSVVTKRTIDDVLQSVSNLIKEISEGVSHIADGPQDYGAIEALDPNEIISAYISKNKRNWHNFEACIHEIPKSSAREKIKSFSFPRKALERIFDNIVANACAHGFSEQRTKKYLIQFSWTIDKGKFMIFVENDGTPLPPNIDLDSLKLNGKSSNLGIDGHEGTGCYEIDKILKKYGGGFKIDRSESGNFSVKYTLIFNHYITNQDDDDIKIKDEKQKIKKSNG